jgi:hypothetical protein
MNTNSEPNQLDVETNKQSKWWHDRRVKIIGISFTVLILLAISLSLLLAFAIPTKKESHSTTTTTTQPPRKF